MSIKDNVEFVKDRIERAAKIANRDPNDIYLLAVSKDVSTCKVLEAIDAGITCIGENRVQEFLRKYDSIDRNIHWHLIGSLQTNKVKYIIDKVELIHSLDRISLAREIDKRAGSIGKKVQVLVQVNISRENTKSGIFEEELLPFIKEMVNYPNLQIKGLMAIGPLTHDTKAIRESFRRLRCHFDDLRSRDDINHIDMRYLSMGMTNDYEIAIEEGANIVRIGRAIFN